MLYLEKQGSNCNAEQFSCVQSALAAVMTAYDSESGILKKRFLDERTYPIEETGGRKGIEVYLHLKNRLITKDVWVRPQMWSAWSPWSKVVGWTSPKEVEVTADGRIIVTLHFARKFWSPGAGLAGNIAHELCHQPCGYGHKMRGYTKKEVPYRVGRWVYESLGGK